MATERPTHGDVERWLEHRRTVLSRLHRAMDSDEEVHTWSAEFKSGVWQPYIKGFPKDYEPILPPIAFLGVMRAVNNTIVGETAEVEVTLPDDAPGDEKQKKERINHLRAWYRAILYKIDTYSTETPIRDFYTQMYKLGPGVLAYPINWERWQEPPHGFLPDGRPRAGRTTEEKEAYRKWRQHHAEAFPWDVYSEHPRRLYFDVDHDPPEDYIIEDLVDVEPYAGELDLTALALKPSGDNSRATRVAYVSPEWYGYWINGQPLLTAADGADEDGIAPNTLGMPWYRMALSGLGDKHASGDFVFRIKGIIRDSLPVIIAKLVSLNIKAVILQKGAYGETLFSGEGAAALRDKWAAVAGPGGAIADELGKVNVSLIPQATVPREAFNLDVEVGQLLEMVLGPEILEGVYSRDETASGQRSRASYAKSPYQAPRQSGQQAIAAMLMDLSQQVREVPQFKAGVTVQGVTLRPADVVDHFVNVDIAPPTEEDRAFKRAAVLDDLKAGIITQEDAIRETRGIDNAEEYMVKVRAEQLAQTLLGHPTIQEWMVQQLAARLGIPPPSPMSPVAPPSGNGIVQEPALIQEPEPSLGSPLDIQQQVQRVVNAPLLPGAPARAL